MIVYFILVKMKTIANLIVLLRNLFNDAFHWRLLKSEGYTVKTVIKEEIAKFKARRKGLMYNN